MIRGFGDQKWVGTVAFDVGDARTLPHFRELALVRDDGVVWTMRLDQGFGYRRGNRRQEFPFEESSDEQVEAANRIMSRGSVKTKDSHPTYVSLARSRTKGTGSRY